MSYSKRNSLILGGLLALVLFGGLYWTQFHQRERIFALEAQETVLFGDLAEINTVVSEYDATRTRLDALEARWAEDRQIVPASDNPASTLAYFFELQGRANARVAFDFRYGGRTDADTHSQNRYELEGRAAFSDLYAFLWQIERGRRFYTIDRIEIVYNEPDTAVYTARWAWVDFRVSTRSYFEPQSEIPDTTHVGLTGRPPALARNPFFPLVTKALPENKDGLLDVSQVKLSAVGFGVAYLADRKGKTHLLREGDPVYLGRLASVDIRHNRVTFRLNKGGILERKTLEIDMNGSTP